MCMYLICKWLENKNVQLKTTFSSIKHTQQNIALNVLDTSNSDFSIYVEHVI